MRPIETESQWANPLDVELEQHPPRRRHSVSQASLSTRRRAPLLPTLTLLAAGGAAVLSVAAITTDDLGNGPTEVFVKVVDERPPLAASDDAALAAADTTADGKTPSPYSNPYEPPIGPTAPVDECGNVPLIRGRPAPC